MRSRFTLTATLSACSHRQKWLSPYPRGLWRGRSKDGLTPDFRTRCVDYSATIGLEFGEDSTGRRQGGEGHRRGLTETPKTRKRTTPCSNACRYAWLMPTASIAFRRRSHGSNLRLLLMCFVCFTRIFNVGKLDIIYRRVFGRNMFLG